MGRAAGSPLDDALKALDEGRLQDAVRSARRTAEMDPTSLTALRVLAMAQERLGEVTDALATYENALRLAPDDPDLLNGLGRLALELDLAPVAAGMARQSLAARPGDPEAVCLLGRALALEGRVQEAIRCLADHLGAYPEQAGVWNALGVLMSDTGDPVMAETAFAEAIRLNPELVPALFNQANLLVTLGETRRALDALLEIPETNLNARERATLRFSRACARLQMGDLPGGWRDYEARNDPGLSGAADFEAPGRRWRPGDPLDELDLLLFGEQGLGDEVLFASLLPDLLKRTDRPARIHFAVEPRLVSLFQRSFPEVSVIAHSTVGTGGRKIRRIPASHNATRVSAWTPIGDLLPVLRPDITAFPGHNGFLIADPQRVLEWRDWLTRAPGGLRVGLLWKSGLLAGARGLSFAGFESWAPVLQAPGVTFVNLQYGDCAEEIAFARDHLGVEILTPPGLDLKEDLEGVAALSCALDLVIGVANASFNLAGACGGRTWLVSGPDAWTVLGSGRYPWYPQVRLFPSARLGDWADILATVGRALAAEAGP
ncbi:MAG: tetratricopeptide repeat protein [Phenylobacterium sp.]